MEKWRYDLDDLVEFDFFKTPTFGAMLAEREFLSFEEADAWEPPEWFGPEVTGDMHYNNEFVAVHGFPPAPGVSLAGAARQLGVSRQTATRYAQGKNLDLTHMRNAKGRADLSRIFCKRTEGKRRNVASKWLRRLYPELYLCACCWNPGEWLGQPVSLELHHVDGDCLNDLLENLEWLCPNCHAQTETYRGKNTAKAKAKRKEAV